MVIHLEFKQVGLEVGQPTTEMPLYGLEMNKDPWELLLKQFQWLLYLFQNGLFKYEFWQYLVLVQSCPALS